MAGIIRHLHPDVLSGPRVPAGLAVLAAAVLLPACAPAVHDMPAELEPGRYAFDGEARLTHTLRSGSDVQIINVSGTFEVHADGEIDAFATTGACRPSPSRSERRVALFDCGAASIFLGIGSGTARVPAMQRHEVRGACERPELDSQGRPTGRCLEWSWREQRRRIQVNVPLRVIRTSTDMN